jgi:hypothetical protein
MEMYFNCDYFISGLEAVYFAYRTLKENRRSPVICQSENLRRVTQSGVLLGRRTSRRCQYLDRTASDGRFIDGLERI